MRVDTVVISTQHAEEITTEDLREQVLEKIVKAVIPANLLDNDTIYHIQPSGRFVIGGPQGDAGLTGRKIIVDSYGGWGAHGGGAFSGKDWSKVDRSGAYAARWIAKSLIAAGLARRVLVQLSYAIGVAEPLSIFVDSYGTSKGVNDAELVDIIRNNWDLRPGALVKELDLQRPIYAQTAAYGHFGECRSYPLRRPCVACSFNFSIIIDNILSLPTFHNPYSSTDTSKTQRKSKLPLGKAQGFETLKSGVTFRSQLLGLDLRFSRPVGRRTLTFPLFSRFNTDLDQIFNSSLFYLKTHFSSHARVLIRIVPPYTASQWAQLLLF